MKYRAMVVDDEPSALQHLCSIIEKRCPSYHVVAQVENGEEALARMSDARPDIVITDVRMPRTDGIELVSRLHAEHPDVVTVIVSGYQDFEYAKGALRSGVSDYLLKPLKPSVFQELLAQLERKLDAVHYRHRTAFMKAMCRGNGVDVDGEISRYFPSKSYYAAILRRNGLPRRFSRHTGIEVFSTEEEKIMIYARDEMEALYLYPEEMLEGRSFVEITQKLYEQELCPHHYVTAVVYRDAFSIHNFPSIVKTIYQKLDESITIGLNQYLWADEEHSQHEDSQAERELREQMEYYIHHEKTNRFMHATSALFELWAEAGHNQIYIENQIRHLLHLVKKSFNFSRTPENYHFLLDEALYSVHSMEELKSELLALIKLLTPSSQQPEAADDAEQVFSIILSYLDSHLADTLTIGTVCRKFNLSQTTLSRWFRKFENNSFSNYLTEIRIVKAQKILHKAPDTYIKDVAAQVGYCDQFYFSRIFRSIVGICPSDFVRDCKAGLK